MIKNVPDEINWMLTQKCGGVQQADICYPHHKLLNSSAGLCCGGGQAQRNEWCEYGGGYRKRHHKHYVHNRPKAC